MQALAAALLALLLCGQPGRGQAQDDQDAPERASTEDNEDEEEQGDEGDEDGDEDGDEEEEVEAAGAPEGGRGTGLQCYTCQNLGQHERCGQTRGCLRSEPFCKTLVSEGDTGSGPLTSYSVWCADKCQPISRKADGTLITVTCCQTSLCNTAPWRSGPGAEDGVGAPQGSLGTVATALLLSLLPGLGAVGS